MELHIGGLYKRRDGKETVITKTLPGPQYKFRDEIGNSYTSTGIYLIYNGNNPPDHPADLVSEIQDYSFAPLVTTATTRSTAPVVETTESVVSNPISSAPSKHAEVIKAWAEGANCQYKGPEMDRWEAILPPGRSQVSWRDNIEYRVKPVNLVKYYSFGKVGNIFKFGSEYDSKLGAINEDLVFNMFDVLLGIKKIVMTPDTFEILEETWETL